MPLHKELGLVCIDAQPDFFARMHGDADAVMTRIERLFMMATMLDLPTIATFEEPTDTKGWFPDRLEAAFPPKGRRYTKATFDALAEKAIRIAVKGLGREAIAVAGAETDVCVVLTVQALRAEGYRVHVVEDCLFTSAQDPSVAIRRMAMAGATLTTLKTISYELTYTCDRSKWPDPWQRRAELFPPPEELETG